MMLQCIPENVETINDEVVAEENIEARVEDSESVGKDFDNSKSLLDTTDLPSDDVIGGIRGLSNVMVDHAVENLIQLVAHDVEKDAPTPSEHLAELERVA